MDFSHSDKVRDLQERVTLHGSVRLSGRSRFTRNWKQSARRQSLAAPKVMEDLKEKAKAHGLVEPVPAAFRTWRRSHQSRIRAACARSWGARTSRPRPSIARRRTPATWKCWPATRRPSSSSNGSSRCSRADPLRFCDDRAGCRLERCHQHQSAIVVRDGDSYVINGRKWWTSGAGDPRCEILIFMGKTNPEAGAHSQQSMILVPMKTPGVKVLRTLTVFGYDHAPHGHAESISSTCACRRRTCCSARDAVSRSRRAGLGPAASIIACADRRRRTRAGMLCKRAQLARRVRQARVGAGRDAGAHCRSAHHDRSGRWLVLNAAYMMDTVGNRAAKQEIAMIKVAAPTWPARSSTGPFRCTAAAASAMISFWRRLRRRAHAAARRRSGRSASRADRQAGTWRYRPRDASPECGSK
jgi:acyl-CoA dehydrogenase